MFDEMSIKKHYHYNPNCDFIEGYQDHGTQGRSPVPASYALVFMIAGIRKKIKQPIAHYFSSGFSTADRLAVLIKEVLSQCFDAGLNIAAIVCDMDGVNRRALAILDEKVGKGIAKWSHIQEFYELDNKNPNFVFAPLLKKEHLEPNSKQKMKVNLAAQVLSHSVAGGMLASAANGSLTPDAIITANLVADMDKLFDLMNADCSDLRPGKPHATNWSSTSPHTFFFQRMKLFFENIKFIGCARRPPSQDGWLSTLTAFLRLRQNLDKNLIKTLATRRIQQDPLENLFGSIRGNCGSNTNPTCGQFVAGLKTAVLANLSRIGTTGNCEADNNTIINNFKALLSPSQLQPTSISTIQLASDDIREFRDEDIVEDCTEIQACAYVCGFIVKKIKNGSCENCQNVFLSQTIEPQHLFVEFKEYTDFKNNLIYASKSIINCVEGCATIINSFLEENSHIKMLRLKIVEILKIKIDFTFLNKCEEHKIYNIDKIIETVFFICVKRFCILKNRTFSQEASAAALKRKMKIIVHQ